MSTKEAEKMQSRYSRQMVLDLIGKKGQQMLKQSHAVVVGCGALGTVIANNLVRAGIGAITIIDRDIVELNNLQRQILFDETDVGQPKASVAAGKLSKINSEVKITPLIKDLDNHNIEKTIPQADVICDATDNIYIRMIINDYCIKNKIP